MASLSTDAGGNRRVLFTHPDGRRKTLYLGAVTKKQGEAVKLRVESLVACLTAKLAMDADTAAWVAGVGDDLAAKLHAVGLCRSGGVKPSGRSWPNTWHAGPGISRGPP